MAKVTDEQKAKIVEMYQQGKSMREIEKQLRHNRTFISKVIKENNLEVRNTSKTSRKYYHNEDFFKTIDTERKAYWLGFLYADGFIESKRKNGAQKVGITLKADDHAHLEKFKKDIGATNPILQYIGSGYNKEGLFSKILLTSNKTVSDLIAKGCFENKTNDLKFPDESIVPKELLKHFIRGYFDGDGSIYTIDTEKQFCYSVSFTGTHSIVHGINDYFGCGDKAICNRNNAYYSCYGGTYRVAQILNAMYEGATVYMDRKFNKVVDFVKYCESRGI